MALYYDLPVYQDVYRLILKLIEITKEFPRECKHTLGQNLKRDEIAVARSIYPANKAKDRTEYLERFQAGRRARRGCGQPHQCHTAL